MSIVFTMEKLHANKLLKTTDDDVSCPRILTHIKRVIRLSMESINRHLMHKQFSSAKVGFHALNAVHPYKHSFEVLHSASKGRFGVPFRVAEHETGRSDLWGATHEEIILHKPHGKEQELFFYFECGL